MGGHGYITVSGEITSSAKVDIENVVRKIVGPNFEVAVHATSQSPQIAAGVDVGGAGDQGIMVGYASTESGNFVPREYEFARFLCQQGTKNTLMTGKFKELLMVARLF